MLRARLIKLSRVALGDHTCPKSITCVRVDAEREVGFSMSERDVFAKRLLKAFEDGFVFGVPAER